MVRKILINAGSPEVERQWPKPTALAVVWSRNRDGRPEQNFGMAVM